MSHTTEITGTAYMSKSLIKEAVALLKKQGCDIEYVENSAVRMYYPDQFKQRTGCETADCVIKGTKPEAYDVGFVKSEDGSYTAYYDNHAQKISKGLGLGNSAGPIGKFTQLEATVKMRRAAKKAGFTNYKLSKSANGEMQLKILVGAPII